MVRVIFIVPNPNIILMSMYFLGIPSDSKFRRIYFTTVYWNAVDNIENKYTLQAAKRKIPTHCD